MTGFGPYRRIVAPGNALDSGYADWWAKLRPSERANWCEAAHHGGVVTAELIESLPPHRRAGADMWIVPPGVARPPVAKMMSTLKTFVQHQFL